MRRSISNETLSTLVNSVTGTVASARRGDFNDAESLDSSGTLAVANALVFGQPLMTYRKARELPITIGILRNELLLYESMDSLKNGDSPTLTFQPNRFHFLKKNTPLHTIVRHLNGQKFDFCKVYYKILETNLTCYVLMFATGENLVLYNNGVKSHSDTIFKQTKLRLYGASGGTSAFGSNSMRIYALNKQLPTLVDFVDDLRFNDTCIKNLKLHAAEGTCKFYDCVVRQQKTEVQHLLAKESTMVDAPIATFLDSGGVKVEGMKVEGVIRLFESTSATEIEIGSDSLVLATIMAVFVEQEIQKMRGNLKV